MLLTHFFETPNAKERARYWLSHHGFYDRANDFSSEDSQWLALTLPATQVPAVQALISSIDRADAEGNAETFRIPARPSSPATEDARADGIHWEPHELDDEGNPRVEAIREFMSTYHE